MKSERGLHELYRDDPERADALIFGRRADRRSDARAERDGVSRRGFLGGTGVAAVSAAVGAAIPFAADLPGGLIPAALAQAPAAPAAPRGPQLLRMDGKAPLVVLQERPLNAETPEHMLDDETTPNDKFFIRNNGLIPDPAANPAAWRLRIDGEVNSPLDLTLADLQSRFQATSLFLQLECGGNGRSFFQPEARGNQWGNGAVGVARWTGVRLRDVLQAAGLKPSAVYTGNFGADPLLTGATDRPTISRGVRIAKAMHEDTLLAFQMNGQPIPNIHGGPLRLVTPGWPGSVSHKWLNRIWIRDREHDGAGMAGASYRVAIQPMVPGGQTPNSNLRVMESMPVRSIITSHAHGSELPAGTRALAIRGAAWAGDLAVRSVEVSVNFGRTWQAANLGAPRNGHDWQRWTAQVAFPSPGYYEVWARATDANGQTQPHVAGDWNPQGYGANPYHRIAVLIRP